MGYSLSTPEETARMITRRHLLDAAGDVFAEHGFRAATVREICQRADANIAAVNYHFGDKEQLYQAVLKESFLASIKKYPSNLGLPPKATPEQRLRAFVHAFLLRIFSEGPSSRHGKLMAREMIEPTGALDAIVEEGIRPMSAVLKSILSDLMDGKANESTKNLCMMSIVSQVLFYHHCRPVVARMFPDMKLDSSAIEKLAEHITQFSLAALKEMKRKRKKS